MVLSAFWIVTSWTLTYVLDCTNRIGPLQAPVVQPVALPPLPSSVASVTPLPSIVTGSDADVPVVPIDQFPM
jgi:hypothetical protein